LPFFFFPEFIDSNAIRPNRVRIEQESSYYQNSQIKIFQKKRIQYSKLSYICMNDIPN
jgi:hypothetical protein